MASSNDIAEYIIDAYTKYGIEIHSTGDEAIILNLPPFFRDVTELCAALNEEFGCIVDLEYDNTNLRAKVWTTHISSMPEAKVTPKAPVATPSCNILSGIQLILMICVAIVALKLACDEHVYIRKTISKLLMNVAKAV